MGEFEQEPNPEVLEREQLIKIVKEYLPDDLDYLLAEHTDNDDLRMAVDASLLEAGFDPDEILLEGGEYEEVRYKEAGDGDEV